MNIVRWLLERRLEHALSRAQHERNERILARIHDVAVTGLVLPAGGR